MSDSQVGWKGPRAITRWAIVAGEAVANSSERQDDSARPEAASADVFRKLRLDFEVAMEPSVQPCQIQHL